ncbi:MAG: SoxR reducing system RseC family protein [Thermoanaerobaculaceae bacterium]
MVGDQAVVSVERASACAQCGLWGAKEAAGGSSVFVATNKARANPGDMVKAPIESVAFTEALLFIYRIPILFFISGAILGAYLAGRFEVFRS